MRVQPNNFFHSLPEPRQSCLLFLRDFLLSYPHQKITEKWHNNTPFYYCDNKWLCFIDYGHGARGIYISFVQGYKVKHPKLISEGRKQQRIFRIDPTQDIDVKSLNAILKLLIEKA